MNKKRFLTVIIMLITVASVILTFTACNTTIKKDDNGDPIATKIVSYKVDELEAYIGDEYKPSNISITATFDNAETKSVTNNRIYATADENAIKESLDKDNKYTKAGIYTLKIYLLEERADLLIGTCTIKVSAKSEI